MNKCRKGWKKGRRDLLVILFINDERSKSQKEEREKQGKKRKWSDINEEGGEGIPSRQ